MFIAKLKHIATRATQLSSSLDTCSATAVSSPSLFRAQTSHHVQRRTFFITANIFKVHKKSEKTKMKTMELLRPLDSSNDVLKTAFDEMIDLERQFLDELEKKFSLTTDIRSYESIIVRLKSGKTHKLSHLGRLTLKSPQMIQINFSENPFAIQDARDAIEKHMNINAQQEGACLYLTVPRVTRQQRESVAENARKQLLNQYKEALDKLYSRVVKRNAANTKNWDREKATEAQLLNQKKLYLHNANVHIEERCLELFKEVV